MRNGISNLLGGYLYMSTYSDALDTIEVDGFRVGLDLLQIKFISQIFLRNNLFNLDIRRDSLVMSNLFKT